MDYWKEIDILLPIFKNAFDTTIDFEKFNRIAVTFHSTAIEGSTLTLLETETLLDKGITPNNKPLLHQQMVLDHHQSLIATLNAAENKTPVTVEFLKSMAAAVMKSTGTKHITVLGEYDVSKGDLRLNNVRAGNQYFVNYDKVPGLVEQLVKEVQGEINLVTSLQDILTLSFKAHFDLVTIHPFGDGNGRTSRLLMNYIQHYHKLPISPVHMEDRKQYIESLMLTREQQTLQPFIAFMSDQYVKYLKNELLSYQNQQGDLAKGVRKGKGYSMIF